MPHEEPDLAVAGRPGRRHAVRRAEEDAERRRAAVELAGSWIGSLEVDRVEERLLLELGQDHAGPAPARTELPAEQTGPRSRRTRAASRRGGSRTGPAPGRSASGCSGKRPAAPARARPGRPAAAGRPATPMIAMTTRSSIRVKPDERRGSRSTLVQARGQFMSSTLGGMPSSGPPFSRPRFERTCRSNRKTAHAWRKLRPQTTRGSSPLILRHAWSPSKPTSLKRRGGRRPGWPSSWRE